jgi:hypothetical protein
VELTTVLDSSGHEIYGWPQLYETYPNFITTYQMLGANEVVDNFHLQDGLLFYLVHLCVPSSERAKLIWEPTTVEWQDTSASKRQWQCCNNISVDQNFNMRLASISRGQQVYLNGLHVGLPSNKWGNDYVFLVVDPFSKMAIMAACKKSITTESTAKLLFEQLWVHFGIPQTIVLDQDSRFLITFWSSLWPLLDMKLTKSMTFYPQTNGQTEVVN